MSEITDETAGQRLAAANRKVNDAWRHLQRVLSAYSSVVDRLEKEHKRLYQEKVHLEVEAARANASGQRQRAIKLWRQMEQLQLRMNDITAERQPKVRLITDARERHRKAVLRHECAKKALRGV